MMKHKRKLRLLLLYVAVIAAMAYSGWQLRSVSAQDEFVVDPDPAAGTCCATSQTCGGTDICYLPDKRALCCDGPGCAGANYCQKQ